MRRRTLRIVGILIAAIAAAGVWQIGARAGDDAGFPIGKDAVEAAPGSHRVIFENALVRVLEVTVPANGQTEPMHHHRWPSFFRRPAINSGRNQSPEIVGDRRADRVPAE